MVSPLPGPPALPPTTPAIIKQKVTAFEVLDYMDLAYKAKTDKSFKFVDSTGIIFGGRSYKFN